MLGFSKSFSMVFLSLFRNILNFYSDFLKQSIIYNISNKFLKFHLSLFKILQNFQKFFLTF